MLMTLALVAVCLLPADPVMDLESLKNVMDGLQADLKDVEFVYEGGIRNAQKGEPEGTYGKTFQGTFAYRSDGSTAIDRLARDQAPTHPQTRSILCYLGDGKGTLEELDFQPDRGKDASRLKTSHGGVPSLSQEGSPMRFLLVPVLLEFLRDSGGYRTGNKMAYESTGWELINGHRCLKVRSFSEFLFEDKPIVENLYWIDLERNGAVLKHEYRYQGRLWARVDGIELASFPIEAGRKFWLPVRGVHQTYVLGKRLPSGAIETSSRPVFEENYVVVDGTVRLNRNLPDQRFTIDWCEAARAPHQAARTRQDFASGRGPAKGAQAFVVKSIEQADRQKRELEALAPSREGLSASTLGIYMLWAFGVAVIGGAFLLKWRGR